MYMTTTEMSKYELTRLVGLRALQLSHMSAQTSPAANGDYTTEAALEILEGRVDFSIRSHLPDGDFEDRPADSLRVPVALIREVYLPRVCLTTSRAPP